jgi:hypothetical protein
LRVFGGAVLLGFAGIEINGQVFGFKPHIILFLLLGAAGIFMRPGEFKEAMRPDEPEAKPAAWIEEMRAQAREQDKQD